MSVVKDGIESEAMEAKIGQLPVMVKSKICNLLGLSGLRKSAMEKTLLTGGYFIIGGTERVVMTLEDLAPNKILLSTESVTVTR
jgi:DNA-directed RNA polymerase subunit B"